MTMQNRTLKLCFGLVSLFTVVLAIALGWVIYHSSRPENLDGARQKPHARKVAQKDHREPAILELTPESVEAMRLRTFEAKIPRYSRVLRLRGSLAIDSNRLSHVHARFPGQIVELATIKGMRSMQAQPISPPARLLQNFDAVEQGIPMAVIWSKDLGEKKSDLANCLATLHTDRITLERLTGFGERGWNLESRIERTEGQSGTGRDCSIYR